MRPNAPHPTDAHPIFSFSNGEMGAISNHLIRSIEKITGQPRIRKLYFDYVNEDLPTQNFWSDALQRLDISISLTRSTIGGIPASIPATGRVLAIANHPYGVIDGLALCALMANVRHDYKIITHRVLRQAPAVMDKILPIDFDETEAALASNLKTRADATKHLKDGGAVIIFPAGAISLAPNFIGNAIDAEWKTFAAKLAQVPNTTTIPFYFDGRNTLLYQMARRVSVTLGYSLMFREICKKMGHSISICMRQPIHASTLSKFGTRTEVTEYLRRCTYGSENH
ncbi:MAG: lysophospholipid acyltransferase family protein [Candidatus Puniceispirillum sp.]|nr:lysophospholipid acyltransferase family protein [Candidatus Puniceispirillum sp.]MBL6774476.1 lysophospholipid acyltransferase family protein [Candidatus Puniceispirillum sp.]